MVMSRRTQLRHRAREIALQLVYMNDMRPESTVAEILEGFPADEAVTLFDGELKAEEEEKPSKAEFPFVAAFDLALSDAEKDEVMSYAADLLRGVRANAAEIEDVIRVNMESKWRPERLVALDKAVISLALYEGTIAKKVPVNVAISEAVEIAKAFGTEESGRFVNGVLGRIARGSDDDKQ